MTAEVLATERSATLQKVLLSRAFARVPRQRKLLQYLCDRSLRGDEREIKEYSIAVDVLERLPDFDPARDATVRVEVHRLRKRLSEYYQLEGVDDRVEITIPHGHYVPCFRVRSEGRGEDRPATEADGKRETDVLAGSKSTRAKPLQLRHYALVAAGFCLIVLAGVAGWSWMSNRHSANLALPVKADTTAKNLASLPEDLSEIRIRAGYPNEKFIDRAGRVWLGDRFFKGGYTQTYRSLRFLQRAFDTGLYRSSRLGHFSYDIPLRPGIYELRLHFGEYSFGQGTVAGGGEGSRVFNVLANGKALLTGFDLVADSGNDTAIVRVFKDIAPAPDGYLHLDFIPVQEDPILMAIEVLPGTPGRQRPIRMVAQQRPYADHAGNIWMPDCYVAGGRLTGHTSVVQDTADPDLYEYERVGNFNYAIPVAPGRYRLTLKFAETFFGPDNPGKGGVGSRIFDLYCNGVALLRRFDIFKEAGGASRALEKTFHGLEPTAQGKLMLSFVPVKANASVTAIEVAAE